MGRVNVSVEQPPGWYPDAAGQPILHWWDGQRWTGDIRPPAGEPSPLPQWARQTRPLRHRGRVASGMVVY